MTSSTLSTLGQQAVLSQQSSISPSTMRDLMFLSHRVEFLSEANDPPCSRRGVDATSGSYILFV
jgi:hypothetical protein